jgi:hypothetical protein
MAAARLCLDMGASVAQDATSETLVAAPAMGRPRRHAGRLIVADPLLVVRRHVDYLRTGSALCLPRSLSDARYS